MARIRRSYVHRRRSEPGSAPGVLRVDPQARPTRLDAIWVAPDRVQTIDAPDLARLTPPKDGYLWLNVIGLGDARVLSAIAAAFGLHPLAMEDAVNLNQRPKAEDYDSHHFIILKMPRPDPNFTTEQVSIFLGPRFVITIQELPGDVFDPVRTRLHNPQSAIRARGADYLTYALIDAVTDSYFPVLERLGEHLEVLEDEVVERPRGSQIQTIHAFKHQLGAIRAAIWPLRDMLAALQREDTGRFATTTRPYLRDCHDHTFQLIEMLETYREVASGLVDLHLSAQANRTNEVMQVLTLIATIFIPLTFIVGVYGMNFAHMPELRWRWGYPVVMAAMAAIAGGLLWWFRRKGWLGGGR